jgi:hypothetical protein
MKPFIQYIKPFNDQNVNNFLEWMESCAEILRQARSTQFGSISSILFTIYAKEALSLCKPKEQKTLMKCAIQNENYLLVFEILRSSHSFSHVFQLQSIFQDTSEVTPVVIETILHTLRKMVLRDCSSIQNNDVVLSFCWKCGQKNNLVIVMSHKGNKEIPDRIPKKIMGCRLILYSLTHLSDEASSILKSVQHSKKSQLPTVTEDEARKLFSKHSNLTMISVSPYKSMGYRIGPHRVVQKQCIRLFCLHKGYVPYGEEQLPKKIGDLEVDVLEGYCVLGSGGSLDIGGYICRDQCGTIGGFVNLPYNKTGLITCAHVIFSSKELEELESINRIPPGIKVEAFDKAAHTYRVCGTCVDAEFPKRLRQPMSPHPNVDAALIELDPAIDTFRLRTVSSDQLHSAGII